MKIGLVSYRCENRDVAFNLSQIERALREAAGRADLLCFGEAFLQGFDSLCWEYEKDREMAVELDSEPVRQLRNWTKEYGTAILTGYIEKDGDALYSSCAVIADGEIIHNYRRISRGWKEYRKTDDHYREGTEVRPFQLKGREFLTALCGDLWDYPERFRTEHTLIWPVYVDLTPEQWENEGVLAEYAEQAALAAGETLMVNPLDREPRNYGGAFRFVNGKTAERTPFDREEILIIDTEADGKKPFYGASEITAE